MLEGGLEEQVEPALEVHERPRVVECDGRLPVDEPPHDAVGVVRAGEQGELPQGV